MVLDKSEEKRLEEAVTTIKEKNDGIRSKAKRKDNWLYGSLAAFYLALIVFGAAVGAWSSVLTTLGLALWMGLVWFQARHIDDLRYILNMQFDLRKLEQDELERLQSERKAKKPAKKATA